MKWALIAFAAFFALLLLLYFIARDRTVSVATKLALAGKHREAEDLIRGVIRDKGETAARLMALGSVLMNQNRLDEALAAFESARRLARRPATAMNNCAMALRKLGRRDEARQLLDDALRLEPNHFIALTNSCLVLAEMGLETEAFGRLERAEEIYQRYDPSQVKPWKPVLEECRQALPRAKGFPVVPLDSTRPG
jgi:tetratricopeptide (TPR) repeat protein